MSDHNFADSTPKGAHDLLSAIAIADDILAKSTDERSIDLADKFLQDIAEVFVPSRRPVPDSDVDDEDDVADEDDSILLTTMYLNLQLAACDAPRRYGWDNYNAFRKFLVRNYDNLLDRDESGRIVVDVDDFDILYGLIF